jgi:primary-amine oxidase
MNTIRVVYFNLGSHHVPHSGDIPNTLMHTSASSVMFTPFNFHDRDPSRTRTSGVKLQLESEFSEGAKPKYYGGRSVEDVELKVVSLAALHPDVQSHKPICDYFDR